MMDDTARNGNMIALAYFAKESRDNALELAQIIAATHDVIDAQTVVDTMAVAMDELRHQYGNALRTRDKFRMEAEANRT